MANGDPQISWQWLAGILTAMFAAIAMGWTRFVSGKVGGHGERLARLEAVDEELRETRKETATNFREVFARLDRIGEKLP